MKILSLPAYPPELNLVENIWDELREKHFNNRAFSSLDAVEEQFLHGLILLGSHFEITLSIAAWPWIFNAIPTEKWN